MSAQFTVPKTCAKCGADRFGCEYRPAQRAGRLFGWRYREAKPERIEATCRQCGYVTNIRPGTVRLAVYPQRFPWVSP